MVTHLPPQNGEPPDPAVGRVGGSLWRLDTIYEPAGSALYPQETVARMVAYSAAE